jgi:hypothetical protein
MIDHVRQPNHNCATYCRCLDRRPEMSPVIEQSPTYRDRVGRLIGLCKCNSAHFEVRMRRFEMMVTRCEAPRGRWTVREKVLRLETNCRMPPRDKAVRKEISRVKHTNLDVLASTLPCNCLVGRQAGYRARCGASSHPAIMLIDATPLSHLPGAADAQG